MTYTLTRDEAITILEQIGRMNVLAISGGRWTIADNGSLRLPVGSGYSVEVEYVPGSDTYNVRRVYTRGAKRWIKGSVGNVYCDQVGEMAYQAHAFRSYDFPKRGDD